MGEMRVAYRIFVGKPERKRPRGRPGLYGRIMLRWIFKKSDGDMDWIVLAENRDR